MKRKVLSVMLATAMTATLFAGCGSDASNANSADATASTTEAGDVKTDAAASGSGSVYYLNFKPEQDQQWQDLAAKYTAETGTEVTVITAADGTYEQTLKSEMAKSEAPTLFQVNGPVGLANWKDYCMDLSGSELYSHLTSDDFVLKDGNAVQGIAYVIETYGIIYNKTILNDYCTMDNAVISSVDEINNFATLKAVADDIQSRLDEINDKFGYDLQGAFTSAGMDGSSDWRFKTHLANLPIYYEYKDKGIDSTDAIEGTYLDNYKQIWDLYITDSTCDPGMLSSKTGDEAESEFGMEEAVFYQNGTWEYDALKKSISDDDMQMIPIYCGVEGEEKAGLCSGTENCWAVNAKASEADQKATLDFMKWLVTSEEGTKVMAEQFGAIPYKKAADSGNVFLKNANDLLEAGNYNVDWTFNYTPNVDEWRASLVAAMNKYDAGGSWDDVKTAFVQGWAAQYKAANK